MDKGETLDEYTTRIAAVAPPISDLSPAQQDVIRTAVGQIAKKSYAREATSPPEQADT